MKKPVYISLIAVLVLQIFFCLLRAFGVIGWRWLWVLTPLWLCLVVSVFYGIYLSIQKKASGKDDLPDDPESKKE